MQVITVYNLAAMGQPYYGSYTYPGWAVMIGWCIAVSSLVPIPVCFLLELLKHDGSLIQVLHSADVNAGVCLAVHWLDSHAAALDVYYMSTFCAAANPQGRTTIGELGTGEPGGPHQLQVRQGVPEWPSTLASDV